MKTIPINNERILSTPDNYQFIPIGNPDHIFGPAGFLNELRDRIFRRNRAPQTDFWATVGRQDGQAIDWTGNIFCSGTGNDASTGITGDEITILKTIHPEIEQNGQKALEKVLVFDNVNFGTTPASNLIRLTVMVDSGQGALVYYQHTTNDDKMSQYGDIEYIQPQENRDYDDNGRDRLDYFFNVPADVSAVNRFIVKVITFSRNPAENLSGLLQRVEKPYRLLRFNVTNNNFDDVSTLGIPDADRTLKTLLLIHGTFSTTEGSFGELLNDKWLVNMTKQFGGIYDQIIAFDHQTIFEGPAANVAKMQELIKPGAKFSQTIDIITTSRGGLVGKTIVNNATINSSLFTVERMAAVACANGVEYFSAGWTISKGLSVLKIVSKLINNVGLEIFTAIAQTGVNFFLQQPGCVVMTIGSEPLTTILNGTPANTNMRYFPITGNYTTPINFKQRVLNLLVNVVYKDAPNDWVVGTAQQAIMPTANYAYGQTKRHNYSYYLSTTFDSIHTQYFTINAPPQGQPETGIPRDAIEHFLFDPYVNIL